MEFRDGEIHDIFWKPLTRFNDDRGWLCELFRHDEIPAEFHPVMAYVSVTDIGITRGPHEHVDQADYFCFLGPSNFKLYLWDAREDSPTYLVKQFVTVGVDNPMAVIVPAGVVHAYRNVGEEPGLVFNCPNRLYRGEGKSEPVDEIRHEEEENSPFTID